MRLHKKDRRRNAFIDRIKSIQTKLIIAKLDSNLMKSQYVDCLLLVNENNYPKDNLSSLFNEAANSIGYNNNNFLINLLESSDEDFDKFFETVFSLANNLSFN